MKPPWVRSKVVNSVGSMALTSPLVLKEQDRARDIEFETYGVLRTCWELLSVAVTTIPPLGLVLLTRTNRR
jgi:hypothetical protein